MSLLNLTRVLRCFIAFFVFTTVLLAQKPETARVIIRIIDPSGAPISTAKIKVFPAPEGPPVKMEVSPTGELPLTLKTGGHALFVSAQGFKSDVRHIEVAGSSTETVIPVMLQIPSFGGPVVVLPDEEAAKQAHELFLSAMPFRQDWWITPEEFKTLPHTAVSVIDSATGKSERYGGVRLSDLLALAGVPMGATWDDVSLTRYIVASGNPKSRDGVSELFSLAELQPGLHEGEILVADSKNDKPLDYDLGPYLLIVSADRQRLRWIEKLNSLVLHP